MELAPGTTHSFDPESLYPRCTDLDDGGTVSIYQSTVGDVGCVVWDAAIVMAKFYEHLLKYPSAQVTGDGGDNKVKSGKLLGIAYQLMTRPLLGVCRVVTFMCMSLNHLFGNTCT